MRRSNVSEISQDYNVVVALSGREAHTWSSCHSSLDRTDGRRRYQRTTWKNFNKSKREEERGEGKFEIEIYVRVFRYLSGLFMFS